jgi:hypothetical protein
LPNVCSETVPSVAQNLELIRAGLAGLAASDPEQADRSTLGAECEQLLGLAGRLQMQLARRLARFGALGGPAADGMSSSAAWLGHYGRLRPWEARQLATVASRLHLLGETVTAFEAAEAGFGDVATIAEGIDRAAETMAEEWSPERVAEAAQPILLEAAANVTPGQLRKAAARIALVLDGESAERRRRQIERQAFLDLGQAMDGVGCVRADMGASDFAVLEKTVDAFAPRPEPGAPRWQKLPGQRRLRGLITACQIALNAAGENGFRERGGAPVRVHVIASAATVDPEVPVSEAPPGRTEFGTILSAAQIRDMAQRRDTQLTTVRVRSGGTVADDHTADGKPLNLGRSKRLFTAAQRDVYLALYSGCAAEGCDRPVSWAAIDHATEWTDGGPTDLANGQPLCDWHNLHKEHQRARRPRRNDKKGRARPDEPPDPDH